MREIKFRGKRVHTGKWVYGDLTRYSEKMSYITVDLLENEICQVHAETVGQYTGLKDRNGVEIYDGDILGGLGHVVWGDSECRYLIDIIGERYEVFFDELSQNELEVIGNIHDNPELVGVKK